MTNRYATDGMDATPQLFEDAGQPTQRRPLQFSPYPVTTVRRFAHPTHISRIPRGTDVATAIRGAAILGLPLLKQGEEIAGVMEALTPAGRPLYPTVVVVIPRRAAKTTSVWSTILGRCESRPGYKVVTTAQDGIRARNRFREVQRELQRAGFEAQPGNRLRWANGDESIEFGNGSRIWVVPPDPAAFRGEAADLMFLDEGGELSQQRSDDLVAGALPLMDTRPGGQIVIAGTPGKVRAGLLWDTLQSGINKAPGVGVVAYMVRDDESLTMTDADGKVVLNRKLLRRIHPGIGTLTDLGTIASRFDAMPLAQFEAEYGCRFPFDASTGAISGASWASCLVADGLPTRPTTCGWGYDVEPDGTTASLVAAWRDDQGRPHVELVKMDAGTTWLATELRQVARKYRGNPIGCDNVGANSDAAGRLEQAGVRLQLLGMRQTIGATARLHGAIHTSELRHYGQPLLDDAVAGAVWRQVGDSGRLFGRRASAGATAPLVAAAVALWLYDQAFNRTRERVAIVHAGGNA